MFFIVSRISVTASLNNVVILCEKNNLFKNSPENNAGGTIEIAQTFYSYYNLINISTNDISPKSYPFY